MIGDGKIKQMNFYLKIKLIKNKKVMIGKTISGVTVKNEFMAFQILHSLYSELRYIDRIIYLN